MVATCAKAAAAASSFCSGMFGDGFTSPGDGGEEDGACALAAGTQSCHAAVRTAAARDRVIVRIRFLPCGPHRLPAKANDAATRGTRSIEQSSSERFGDLGMSEAHVEAKEKCQGIVKRAR